LVATLPGYVTAPGPIQGGEVSGESVCVCLCVCVCVCVYSDDVRGLKKKHICISPAVGYDLSELAQSTPLEEQRV
jgi:hypothetical protein